MRTAMKMIIGMPALTACQSGSDRVKGYIPGAYVNHSKSAYSVADDTLEFINAGDNHFKVLRRTGYQAIRDGKLLKRRFKLEKLEGDYDPRSGSLSETGLGRVFRFDVDQQVFRLKDAVYRKL